jgi:heme/copper-type cytochrome/quinol oxidase subunit 2
MRKTVSDRVPLLCTMLVLVGLPAVLWAYGAVYLPHKYPGARILTLTALAGDGVWTQEPVVGLNYWRRHFTATPEIELRQGQPVVLRLASADVLHSFAIPALQIGPIEVPAGEVREVRFTPERPGQLLFLCWQVCSHLHEKLRGTLLVVGADDRPAPTSPSEPEL